MDLKSLNVCNGEKIQINIKNTIIGDGSYNLICGPCVVQSESQLDNVCKNLVKNNIKFLRGGTYKLRTSPYSFQGYGLDSLKLLKKYADKYNLITVSELPSTDKLDEFIKYVDIIQVGMRNMSNFELLKKLGKTNKPILLKRGNSATIEEFLLAAEYIYNNGNPNIILCERGIRTFETYTRNTMDIAGAIILKTQSRLPVIIDPSHGTGKSFLVRPFARLGKFVGLDGCMIEATDNPEELLCDKEQAIDLEELDKVVQCLNYLT